MSNEKLGTEQGRETAMNKNNYCSYQTATHYCGKQGGHIGEHYLYLKLIAGHQANCINFRDGAMCDCGALEPQAEQADHARGAGRTCHCGTPSEPHNESVHEEAWAEHILKMATTRREPGADTGTTPPPDGLRARLVANLSEVEGWDPGYIADRCLTALAAERGTPSPRFSEVIDAWQAAHHATGSLADMLDSLKEFASARAATQRAPVEQGRETPKPPSINANQTAAEQFHEDILSIYGARSQTALRVTCREIFERREREVLKAAAPDHAREGAL